jgi:hypothetical protein
MSICARDAKNISESVYFSVSNCIHILLVCAEPNVVWINKLSA